MHHIVQPLLEHFDIRVTQRIIITIFLQKLAKEIVLVVTHRLIERQRLATHLDDAASIVNRSRHDLQLLPDSAAANSWMKAAVTDRTRPIVSIMYRKQCPAPS